MPPTRGLERERGGQKESRAGQQGTVNERTPTQRSKVGIELAGSAEPAVPIAPVTRTSGVVGVGRGVEVQAEAEAEAA